MAGDGGHKGGAVWQAARATLSPNQFRAGDFPNPAGPSQQRLTDRCRQRPHLLYYASPAPVQCLQQPAALKNPQPYVPHPAHRSHCPCLLRTAPSGSSCTGSIPQLRTGSRPQGSTGSSWAALVPARSTTHVYDHTSND